MALNFIKFSKAFLFIIFFALLCVSTWRDYQLLFQTPLAVGTDGYYYVLQIESLRNNGSLYFPSHTPLFIYFLMLLRFLTHDTITTIKLGALLFHLLLGLGVFSLVKTLTNRFWLGFCSLLIINFSVFHFYFISEFLNNLGAITFLIWSLYFFIKAIQKPNIVCFFVGLLFLFAAIFSHRSILPLIILIGVVVFFILLLIDEKVSFQSKKLVICFILIVSILPLFLAWQSIFTLSESTKFEILRFPQLPFYKVNFLESLILFSISIISLYCFFYSSQVFQNKLLSIVLLSIVLLCIFVNFNPFLNHKAEFVGIVGRLGCLSYVELGISLPLLLFLLQNVAKKLAFVAFLTLFFLFVLWRVFSPIPISLQNEAIQKRIALVNSLNEIKTKIPIDSIIGAPHGEQFVVTAITGIQSQQKPPIEEPGKLVFWLLRQLDTKDVNIIESSDFSLLEDKLLRNKLVEMSIIERQRFFFKNSNLLKTFNMTTGQMK